MKPTVLDLRRKKGARLAMLTAYDFPTARLVAEAGVDLILVGDSLGMVVLGYDTTLPVTVADMVHHTRAVRRGAPEAFVIADLPFLSYGTPAQALDSAARLMKEALADSVKLEGGEEVVPIVEALVRAGVPVMGHVGLTPQTASALGGYKLQGKDEAAAKRIMDGAVALERAGCWSVVLELVPAPLAKLVTERIEKVIDKTLAPIPFEGKSAPLFTTTLPLMTVNFALCGAQNSVAATGSCNAPA